MCQYNSAQSDVTGGLNKKFVILTDPKLIYWKPQKDIFPDNYAQSDSTGILKKKFDILRMFSLILPGD